jgi:putative transcriptional regulator
VIPNLSLGHSLDSLTEIGQSYSAEKRAKIFAGYSGWSAGQLEAEIKRKAWVTHPASLELIFADEDELWRRILREMNWQHRLLADSPEDLSWN